MPAWLAAPVLAIAIPHSPFGWGTLATDPAIPAAATVTHGFLDAEDEVPPQPVAPLVAVSVPPVEVPAPVVIAVPPVIASNVPVVPTVPAPTIAAPVEAASSAALPPASVDAAIEAVIPAPAETMAEALRRSAAPPPPSAPADASPPPPPAGELPAAAAPRPAASVPPPPTPGLDPVSAVVPLRAQRPLGAPPASPRVPGGAAIAVIADILPETAAGTPNAPPAALVEPQSALDDTPADQSALVQRPGEPPTMRNRRMYRRVGVEAEFEIDGVRTHLVDLSMEGFAAGSAPQLPAEGVVPVAVRMAIDGVNISTRMKAQIVYANEPRSGGRFIDLTPSQTAFLRYLVTWRGAAAAGALGTSSLLEAISRIPERQERPALPMLEGSGRRPWWSRLFGRIPLLLGRRRLQ